MTHASRSYTRVRRATEDVRILYSMSENKHVDKANYLIESLCNVVVPAFKLEFANVYDRVKARSPPEFVIRNFQEELERAPDRTVEQGRDMLELIVSVHACPWLAGLLNDIVDEFRSLIGYTGTVAITPEAFLNNCYRNIARDLWKRPYLLFDKFDRYECCKNKSIYDGIVKYAVVGTVSEIIPIEKIHSAQIETVIDGEAAGDAGEDECRHRPQRVRHQRRQLHRKQQRGRGRGPHHRLLRDIGFRRRRVAVLGQDGRIVVSCAIKTAARPP